MIHQLLCVVRAVPDSFPRALHSDPVELNTDTARRQHAGYVAALREAGCDVVELPADEAHPDCCFIEDTAVVLGETAVITQPGAASRVGEVGPVAAELAKHRELVRMTGSARLDGGDVLRAGTHLFIGLSTRTNRDGARLLAQTAKRQGIQAKILEVPEGLHLKSFVTLAGHRTVVHAPVIDPSEFQSAGLDALPVHEPAGANVLSVGDRVLVSASAPRTAEQLAQRKLDVVVIAASEFHRADGALTCLSLRVPPPGDWAT